MTAATISVFTGSLIEAQIVQCKLEAHGIPCHVPKSYAVFDAPVAGTNIYDTRVEIPSALEGRAREVLAAQSNVPSRSVESNAGQPAIPEPLDSDLAELAARIRWSSLSGLTAPYACFLGWQYVRVIRQLKSPPPFHTDTLMALYVAAPLSFLFAVAIVVVLGRSLFG